MALNENTIRSDLFKQILATIKTNVSGSVKVTNSFTNDGTQLPQIVILTPSVEKMREMFGNSVYSKRHDVEIDIEIYASKKASMVTLLDEVASILENNPESFGAVDVEFGRGSDGSFDLEGKNIHVQTLPVMLQLGDVQ